MSRLMLLPLMLLVLLLACQKEIDWGLNGGGGTGGRLFRIKSQTGTDTSQTDYTYDAAGRLIREKVAATSGTTDLGTELIINRNSSGIITTTVQKAAALVAVGVDSIVTRFNYNSTTARYTSAIFTLTVLGFGVTDSAVFTYDAGGRISKDEHYSALAGLPIPLPPTLSLRNTYTYDASGNNLLNVTQEAPSAPGGPLAPIASQTYTYDTRTNPLVLKNEAILVSRFGLYSSGNILKAIIADITDPTNNLTTDYTYRYNATNRPDSSYAVPTPAGDTTKAKYFYQ